MYAVYYILNTLEMNQIQLFYELYCNLEHFSIGNGITASDNLPNQIIVYWKEKLSICHKKFLALFRFQMLEIQRTLSKNNKKDSSLIQEKNKKGKNGKKIN